MTLAAIIVASILGYILIGFVTSAALTAGYEWDMNDVDEGTAIILSFIVWPLVPFALLIYYAGRLVRRPVENFRRTWRWLVLKFNPTITTIRRTR